jgi:uncharacterized paraquat-inducible protein A
MTAALLLDRPASHFDPSTVSDRMTLEDRLNSVLQAARTNGSAECPVCHACMASTRAGARAEAVCGACGSRLS